jgi:hypothetical protein
MHNARTPGVTSLDLSKITSIQQLATLLQPFFLSSSLGTAPNAQGGTGNRTVVLTTKSQYTQTVNGQSGGVIIPQPFLAQAAFVAGSYTFNYSAAGFKVAPIVIALPIGSPPSAGTSWFLNGAPSATTAVIHSTDVTDARTLELAAFPNPN